MAATDQGSRLVLWVVPAAPSSAGTYLSTTVGFTTGMSSQEQFEHGQNLGASSGLSLNPLFLIQVPESEPVISNPAANLFVL